MIADFFQQIMYTLSFDHQLNQLQLPFYIFHETQSYKSNELDNMQIWTVRMRQI